MSVRQPLLVITLRGSGDTNEGRVPAEILGSLLRDFQLAVRRLGSAVIGEILPKITAAEVWHLCTLEVIAFKRGSFSVHIDVPEPDKESLSGSDDRQPLGAIVIDRLLDIIVNLTDLPSNGTDLPSHLKLASNLMPPLRRILRLTEHGTEIEFARLGGTTKIRDVTINRQSHQLFDTTEDEWPHERFGAALLEEPQESTQPKTARDLVLALRRNGLIGKWKDRTDIGETEGFVKRLRDKASKRSNE